MPVEVVYAVENRVITALVCGELAWHDVDDANRRLLHYFGQSSEPLILIVDLTDIRKYLVSLPSARRMLSLFHHPRLAWLFIIGAGSRAVETAITTMLAITHVRSKFFTSRSECMAYLKDCFPELAQHPIGFPSLREDNRSA